MAENIKRQTAYIVGIDEINNSKYTKSEGEWDPNYLIIRGLKISRVNIIGVIISISGESNIESFVIDDGFSNIQVRNFDNSLNLNLEIGDIVLIIGKPREYNDEKYIVPEIVKKIENEGWIEFRKKQLKQIKPNNIPEPKIEKKVEVAQNTSIEEEISSDTQTIYDLVKKLDPGEGADIEEIIQKSNITNTENIINSLLKEGEIFEIRPGKIKVLE